MSRIIVTGGEGFIGSALCHKLADMDHTVISVDNQFNTSARKWHDDVTYYTMEAEELGYETELDCDYIFHLGEYARVEQSFDDFDTVMDYNYHSFPAILNFAKEKNAKLIYSGSSTKFAEGGGKNMSPYAFTKAQNTELLKNYADWYGLDYTIVYFYNVYGEGENGEGKYATVVQKFLEMAFNGAEKFPVTSPGTQLRNFTHIDDIVDGLILAGFRGQGDNYGIGSDTKYSILDLVDMLGGDAEMRPPRPGNRMNGELKTDKLKALGWSAKKDLKDYIREELDNEEKIRQDIRKTFG